MSGQTKIMTVSYGAFSCTLEGFDDPLPTLVAVMEYFRDLSEGNAGFGVQPLLPDETAIERFALLRGGGSVDAQVGEAGLTLRPRQIETFAEPPAVPAPPRVTTEAQASMIARQNRIRAAVAQFRGHPVRPDTAMVEARTDTAAVVTDRLRLENPVSFGEPGIAASTAREKMQSAPSSLSVEPATGSAGPDLPLPGTTEQDAMQSVGLAPREAVAPTVPGGVLVLTGALPRPGPAEGGAPLDRPPAVAGEQSARPTPEIAPDTPTSASPVSHARTASPHPRNPQDIAVERLLHHAETEFDQPAHRRRFSAMSHLKAAVAATEAEKRGETAGASRASTQIDRYREDLARARRQSTPQPNATADEYGAAGRVVSDDDADALSQPFLLGPDLRIVAAGPGGGFAGQHNRLALQHAEASGHDDDEDDEADDAADDAPVADDDSFGDFAAKIGAHGLPELLEAAAAHAACVEGREHFTRPHILRKVVAYSGGQGITREDGLRSFGMLLRQGTIHKVRRGQFALSQTSRFIPEAQRLSQ